MKREKTAQKAQEDETSGLYGLKLKKDEFLCKHGDKNSDLYKIHSGKLMVFVTQGTKVTPIAYIGAGEYVGELSFFDEIERSAYVVAIEPSKLTQIPRNQLKEQFPDWLLRLAKFMTLSIRRVDFFIAKNGTKRKNTSSVAPLSIEEQRHFYTLLS